MAHGSRRLTTKKTTTTLAFRMLAAFTAVILISAVVLVVVVDRIILNTARAERGEQQTRDAEALTSQLNADLSNRFVGLAARSNNMHSLGFTSNPPGLQRLLGAIQQSMPDYLWVGFIGQTGQILSSTDALLNGSHVSDRPWFKGGLTKPTFIDFHTAALLTQSVLSRDGAPLQLINLSLPVRSAAGDVVGVLVAYLSQQWLESQVAQHFDGQHHVQRAQHTLIGRDGAMRIGDTISDSMVSAILQDGRPRGWIRKLPRQVDS